MGRPRLDFGEIGKISCSLNQRTGLYRARCQYRDQTGVIRWVEANESSQERARKECEKRARTRAATDESELNLNTELSKIIDLWEQSERDRVNAGIIGQETLNIYMRLVDNRIRPGLGAWTLRNCKAPGRLDKWVRDQAGGHYSVHRDLKRLLVAILGYAVKKNVLEYNPAAAIDDAQTPKRKKVTFTPEQVELIRDAAKAYEDPQRYEKKRVGGRRRAVYLYDFVTLMLATGCRISELLGLKWSAVDLTANPPTVRIEGQMKTRKANKAAGLSYLYWSPKLKTDSSRRTLTVRGEAVDILLRLHINNDSGSEFVFCNENGGARSPVNVRNHLRRAMKEAEVSLPASKTHSFRKTVLTWIDEDHGIQAASVFAGHSEVSITEQAYVQRSTVAPDIGDTVERRMNHTKQAS